MRRFLASTLILSLLTSSAPLHADGVGPTPIRQAQDSVIKLKNVELNEQGELLGQYVDHQGQGLANIPVLVKVGKMELKALTGERGQFAVKNLKSGRAVIRIGEKTFACQLWANGSAPPQAIKTIAMVADDSELMRGNLLVRPFVAVQHLNPLRLLALSGKQLLGLGLIAGGATAIAVSANDDDDDAS